MAREEDIRSARRIVRENAERVAQHRLALAAMRAAGEDTTRAEQVLVELEEALAQSRERIARLRSAPATPAPREA
ncbi:MAG: hypothetical protein WA840_23270 [Caulobacteraceae bacterium]